MKINKQNLFLQFNQNNLNKNFPQVINRISVLINHSNKRNEGDFSVSMSQFHPSHRKSIVRLYKQKKDACTCN